MSNLAPFLLVATLVAAVGAAGVSQAHTTHPSSKTVAMAQLRTAAGHASSIGPGVLVLASR